MGNTYKKPKLEKYGKLKEITTGGSKVPAESGRHR